MHHPSAKGVSQSGEEPTPSNRVANGLCCPGCLHRRANMAVADNFVELIVGQFEEALCLAVAVVFQPFITKKRILEGNRYGRAFTPHDIAFGRRTVFSSGKCGKEPVGLLFKDFCPAFETLGSVHSRMCQVSADLGHCVQLVQCLVPHGNLLRVGGQTPNALCRDHTAEVPLRHLYSMLDWLASRHIESGVTPALSSIIHVIDKVL